MGFVKTCNRAVFELDKTDHDILLLNSDTEVTEGFLEEMQSVLYLSERHGAVCPRSNRATFLTVPINATDISPEESYQIFQNIKNHLSRYNVIPTGVGLEFKINLWFSIS